MPACTSKFTAHKVRKIRWQPVPKNSLQVPNKFVTGSWDETENIISLWSISSDQNEELDPKILCETKHPGDLTELKFLNTKAFVTGSTNGSVLQYTCDNQNLKLTDTWKIFSRSCTSLDTYENEVITVGEDGEIAYLNCNQPKTIHNLGSDICTINTVRYLNQFEIATANIRGQLKIWDLREKGKLPSRKFTIVGDCVGIFCLSQHPHQHQVIASGGEDGTLCIWDTRQEKYPVNLLSAHDATMLEVKFHPNNPNHLFTCSQNGSVWHWDCSAINQASTTSLLSKGKPTDVVPESNPWLACSAAKHRLEICSLLPTSFLAINSIDIATNTLICGSDNEAFYVIPNVIDC